jgi:hypothetical protein
VESSHALLQRDPVDLGPVMCLPHARNLEGSGLAAGGLGAVIHTGAVLVLVLIAAGEVIHRLCDLGAAVACIHKVGNTLHRLGILLYVLVVVMVIGDGRRLGCLGGRGRSRCGGEVTIKIR